MRLDQYNNNSFNRGKPLWIELLWIMIQSLLISSWIPGTLHRKILLKLFGAKIGKSVTIKPYVRVKFPWRLEIGDYSWIGESVWIDNLAFVSIGSHCCISQGVYLCTGNHDWSSKNFDLIVKPIKIMNHVWLGARSIVSPGVKAEDGSVLSMGAVATNDLKAWWINQGNPAKPLKERLKCDSFL